MPVVIDDPTNAAPPRPAVYPPSPPGTPPSAGGGAAPPSVWVGGTPGTPGTPGYTPDYAALIKASPEYRMWLAGAEKNNANYATQRAAIIRQLLVQFGAIPPGWQDALGDIRPEDIAAAQGNQFSTEAGIQRNYDMSMTQMQRALAARGMLQSGDLVTGQQQADIGRGQQEYDAVKAFLNGVSGAVGDWTQGVAADMAGEGGVISGLSPIIRELYPATAATEGTAGTPGHWAAGTAAPEPTRTATYTPPPTPRPVAPPAPLRVAIPATPIPRPRITGYHPA